MESRKNSDNNQARSAKNPKLISDDKIDSSEKRNNRHSNNSTDERNSFEKHSPKLHDKGNKPLGNTSYTREPEAYNYKQHARSDSNESSANGHTPDDNQIRNKQYAQDHNGSSDIQNTISNDESDSDFTIITKEMNNRQSNNSTDERNRFQNSFEKLYPNLDDEGDNPLRNTSYTREHEAYSYKQHTQSDPNESSANGHTADDDEIKSDSEFTIITKEEFIVKNDIFNPTGHMVNQQHGKLQVEHVADDIDTSFDVSHIYGHKRKNRQSNNRTDERNSFQKLSPNLHDKENNPLYGYTREHEACGFKQHTKCDSNESCANGHTFDNESNKQYNESSDTENTISNDESDSESATVPKEVFVVGNDIFNPTADMEVENDIATDVIDNDIECKPYSAADDIVTSYDLSHIYGYKRTNSTDEGNNQKLSPKRHDEGNNRDDTRDHDESKNMEHSIEFDANIDPNTGVLVYKRSKSEANSNIMNESKIDCDDLVRGISSICGDAVEDLKEKTTDNNKESNDEKKKSGIDWMKILSGLIEILYDISKNKPDSEAGTNSVIVFWIEIAQKIASLLYGVYKEW